MNNSLPPLLSIPDVSRAGECDSLGRISLRGALELVQDISARHACLLGVDGPALWSQDNAYWVLFKLYIEFDGPLWRDREIVKTTWPAAPEQFRCHRYCRIDYADKASEDVKPVLTSYAEWLMLDTATRQLRPVDSTHFPIDLDFRTEKSVEHSFARLRDTFTAEDFVGERTVRPMHIDVAHHTNNTYYAAFMTDTFPVAEYEDMTLESFEIHYVRETLEGERLSVYRSSDEDGLGYKFAIRKQDGSTAVLAHLRVK